MTHTPLSQSTLLQSCARFYADEDGAVTVDWVVLTAAIVGLGIAVLVSVGTAAKEYAVDTQHCLNIVGDRVGRLPNDPTTDGYNYQLAQAGDRCGNVR